MEPKLKALALAASLLAATAAHAETRGPDLCAAIPRAEACDVGCLAAGREPNLYSYEQKRIGAALCVLRRPRADRDLATGPITACTLGGGRRLMLSISRKQGLAAAPMETVKALLDRAGASVR